jgi:ABC-2 type transport system ATP-binding protein
VTAIEIEGLYKAFGDVVAVDGLDMTVREGEVFGFLGPNGAGKSTTINALLGFLTPDEGTARVLGHDVETESLALRERIGVLPEGFTAYERLTGREHVAYAADLKGVEADADALFDRVGLSETARDRPAGGYSKGMSQRLALACALVGDPDLLVLDEPSSGLDPTGMAEIRELIREEAEAGTTVFFSSHLLSEVEAVCDRVGILVGGRLVATGSIDELRDDTATLAPIELELDHTPTDLELGDVEGVAAATVADDAVRAEVTDPTAKIAVIRRVDEVAEIRDVIAEEASLEALFSTYADGDDGADDGDDGTEREVPA